MFAVVDGVAAVAACAAAWPMVKKVIGVWLPKTFDFEL
jgi:hypothetical protein